MSNAKNTIQNISLTGQLNLNTLKTNVHSFEGFNEKNSTVFGGELSPLYDKSTRLFESATSHTIYNSKGDAYTINTTGELYKNDIRVDSSSPSDSPYFLYDTLDLNIPKSADWASYFLVNSSKDIAAFYLKDGKLYGKYAGYTEEYGYAKDSLFENTPWTNIGNTTSNIASVNMYHNYNRIYAGLNPNKAVIVVTSASIDNSYIIPHKVVSVYIYIINIPTMTLDTQSHFTFEDENIPLENLPMATFSFKENNNALTVCVCNMSGHISVLKAGDPLPKTRTYTIEYVNDAFTITSTGVEDNFFIINDLSNNAGTFTEYKHIIRQGNNSKLTGPRPAAGYVYAEDNQCTFVITPHGYRAVYCPKTGTGDVSFADHPVAVFDSFLQDVEDIESDTARKFLLTGSDTLGNISSPLGTTDWYLNNLPMIYYTADGNFFGAHVRGMPIMSYGDVYSNNIYVDLFDGRTFCALTYKSSTGWVVAKCGRAGFYNYTDRRRSEFLKNVIIDNRYIWLGPEEGFYDIESDEFIDGRYYGFVTTSFPHLIIQNETDFNASKDNLTSASYVSAYNPLPDISLFGLVGYMPSYYLMANLPVTADFINVSQYPNMLNFFSKSVPIHAPEYYGNDSSYLGTIYPTDPSGNTSYPFSINAEIITGFSNNDMIKVGDTVYPLLYTDINRKLYTYYALSLMDNVTGAFVLQGQQYIVDDNNIYAVVYNNSILQDAQVVAYKKDMQFLGALPTQAIFYSKMNKSLYAFMGDRILSKMLDASDINEIYFVGMNSATLSLWICTDKGIYILSDKDMFKLDYITKNVTFMKDHTIVTTEKDNYNYKNEIYLYNIGDDELNLVPIKLSTCFYGVGQEQKSNFDCWYFRLHSNERKAGYFDISISTITDISKEVETKHWDIEPSMYDENNIIYLKYQPKFQSAVATQLKCETDVCIYQLSLGVNVNDNVAQDSKFNF